MSLSKKLKEAGLKSVRDLSRKSGVSETTLQNWSKNKPKQLDILIAGVLHGEAKANS